MDDAGKSLLLRLRKMICDVYSELGKGYPENVYQRALGVELQNDHIPYDMEVTMSVPYKDHVVGQVRADILLRGAVPCVIETKATAASLKLEERWQTVRYMKILNLTLGVLVNFPQVASSSEPQIEFLVLLDGKVYLYSVDTSECIAMT